MQYLHGDNAFRLYDEQFRKLKESVNIPWQNPVQELRLLAATLKVQNKPSQSQPFRTILCYQFNKEKRCNRNSCPFKHCCLQCKSKQKVSSQNLPTPVNPTKLHNYLIGYDFNKLQYLIEGFQQGFHLGYTAPPIIINIQESQKYSQFCISHNRFYS